MYPLGPILKKLIAVNTFVPPWGLRIIGSDFFVCWGGVGVKAINLFKVGARRGLDVTAGAVAAILKKVDCGKHVCVTLGPEDHWFGFMLFAGVG